MSICIVVAHSSNRLLLATSDPNDAVKLLQAAAKVHIPVNPSCSYFEGKDSAPIQPSDRPAIGSIVTQIHTEAWYKDQIVESRIIDATEAQMGTCSEW